MYKFANIFDRKLKDINKTHVGNKKTNILKALDVSLTGHNFVKRRPTAKATFTK